MLPPLVSIIVSASGLRRPARVRADARPQRREAEPERRFEVAFKKLRDPRAHEAVEHRHAHARDLRGVRPRPRAPRAHVVLQSRAERLPRAEAAVRQKVAPHSRHRGVRPLDLAVEKLEVGPRLGVVEHLRGVARQERRNVGVGGLARRHRGGEEAPEARHHVVDQREQQRLLRGEVPVDRPLRQLQPRRDVGERRLRIALLREERERARENPRARPFSFLFCPSCHAWTWFSFCGRVLYIPSGRYVKPDPVHRFGRKSPRRRMGRKRSTSV